MSIEEMKQVLKALDSLVQKTSGQAIYSFMETERRLAIQAGVGLRQAIEQAQQAEPYGYLKLNTGRFVNEVEGLNPMTDKRYLPLYTSPPPRQPLTEEEIFECENSVPDAAVTDRAWCIHFARAIEAKLKEKNT